MILCFLSTPAPLCRKAANCLLSARCAAACRLEEASWRHRRTPVTAARLSQSTAGSNSWSIGRRGADSRSPCCLIRRGVVQPSTWRLCGDVLLHHGGHSRLAVNFRSLLATGARGLCGKNNEAPDRPSEDPQVPGQGLFKFKELLDGYIARTWPTQKSALGSALDPLADKILISILYVSLTYAELIPALLTALVVFRDIGLIAAVFWVRYKTVPPPVTLSKFFNPCYTTAQLKPTLFSKVNTAIQLVLVAASLAAPVFQYTDSVLLQCLWYVTAITTTVSGYSYWHYGRKTVQVLNTRSP
ncbi:cardiolipin synthase (CMP-forming) isoform X3 [Dunckerocampus dactyliophorus]|uniref:cardiolipin synthase (CMP-forming) isoform X3 n=1 Tax=Dunckerocampus dactyliophorus TaxID=161453 RepID=UPI00240694BB|nr:cardiolipin synthase (CMP-forming) isoform X3 [Dunckerocampus dactyliophorus]